MTKAEEKERGQKALSDQLESLFRTAIGDGLNRFAAMATLRRLTTKMENEVYEGEQRR